MRAVWSEVKRVAPAMFAGGGACVDELEATQLFALVLEHVIAQHHAGQVSSIEVELDDECFGVRDDGPGCGLEGLFAGGGGRRPLLRLGRSVRRLELESCRHGVRRRWLFEGPELRVAGEVLGTSRECGTHVRVRSEASSSEREILQVEQRLLDLHRVRPSLRVSFNAQRFDEPRGVEAWVAGQRCARARRVHHIEARRGTTELELAWVWLPAFGSARRLSYVNLRETPRDGSHVDGLLAGLARVHGVPLALVRERCLAMISVQTVNPRFSEADGRLQDPALERWIAGLVEAHCG